MKRKKKEYEAPISGVNIVPVIDVTLVLLVILLVMSPVLNLPNLPLELPEAITKETKDENITVSLGSDGRISIDSEIIDNNQLGRRLISKLKDRKDDSVVIVRADKNLPYGNVEGFIRDVNRFVGNRAVAIATQQRTTKLEPTKQ